MSKDVPNDALNAVEHGVLHTEPKGVVLIGDHLVAAPREPVGMAPALADALDAAVLDYGQAGGLRDVYRALPGALDALGHYRWAPTAVVFVLGATDSRGGGAPPWAYATAIRRMVEQVRLRGAQPYMLWAPPWGGFRRDDRRWLTRTPKRCFADFDFPWEIAKIPEDGWGNTRELRHNGQKAVVAQIVEMIRR